MRWTPEDFCRATEILSSRLEKKRFMHTLGVVQTAIQLAARHGGDSWRVSIAALLHDCAKTDDAVSPLQKWNERFGVHAYENSPMPQLLHAPAGAWQAYEEFGVDDEEILDAIAWHPTGHPNPSLTLTILMAADYCEPSRDFPGVEEIRELVRKDIYAGVREILLRKIRFVEERGRKLHPATRETLLSLM